MYPKLSDANTVCDYVGSNGNHFAEEALAEWESLCSVWPLNADRSPPVCHTPSSGRIFFVVSFVVAVGTVVFLYLKSKHRRASSVDKSQLIT